MSQFDLGALKACVVAAELTRNLSEADLDETFQGLGYDSIDLYALFNEIEKRSGLTISDADLQRLDTPRRLIEHVQERLGA
jgi:acyl carrier protein